MWQPHIVTVSAAAPLTVAEARAHCGIASTETGFDSQLAMIVAAAVDHVERWTGTKLAEQTVELKTGDWADLARVPVGPVQSVSAIAYRDSLGATQTLATSIYELHGEGTLRPSIQLQDGQSWPAILANASAITVTLVCGYDALPDAVKAALLMLVAQWFENRGAANVGNIVNEMPNGPRDLLVNRRLWAF
jgi:uncharacterized phiE125 gp8 family phage protein